MNLDIEKICNALLYEGYALFPYRKNALKNQKRFNFGVLSPKSWAEKQINEHYFQQVELLVLTEKETNITFQTQFLQLSNDTEWQTATERQIAGEFSLDNLKIVEYKEDNLFGKVKISSEHLANNVFKVRFVIENLTEISNAETSTREQVLQFSFVSTHTIFQAENARFISQLEPPHEFVELTKSLQNIGVFPVLIGDKFKQNNVLASPIILYDFPEASEKSFDNFFDGLEIDELMILNIMALTDEEKRQIAETDERTRQIIEKINSATPEDLLRLHASLR